MNTASHNKLVSFIWSIADDCLRDIYVRGKYRDVILPMVVLRRLDALLEPSKDAVLEEVAFQRDDEPGVFSVERHVFDRLNSSVVDVIRRQRGGVRRHDEVADQRSVLHLRLEHGGQVLRLQQVDHAGHHHVRFWRCDRAGHGWNHQGAFAFERKRDARFPKVRRGDVEL